MKKRVISLAATAVFILGALSGCGSTSSDNSTQTTKETTEETASSDASTSDGDLVTVRDAVMTGQLDQYATEVGLWQGIFEKYGIDLKTTEFVAGINTIDSVVSGTADIGMMADYAAVNRLGNTLDATDLKIFSQLSGGGTAQSGGLYVDPKYADDLESLDGSAGFMYQEGTVTYYYASKCIEYLGLDAVVLAVVSKEKEGTYGYKITQDVRGVLDVSESTLYPVLRRLQKDDCLEVYDMAYAGRNRRYYKLTDRGAAQLEFYKAEWKIYASKISGMFEGGIG